MDRYPAIALIEFGSVAVGTAAGDAMVKAAPIDVIRAGTIQPGKHLVLVGGSVAAVEVAYVAGMRVGGAQVLDTVLLPDVHDEVHDAVFERRRGDEYDALGIIETATVSAVIRAADAAVKGADVHVLELRMGDGLNGRGLLHLTGMLTDVEAAMEIGTAAISDRDVETWTTIIPQLHEDMGRRIGESTRFFVGRGG
jgi:microcompartment protein CcmL/EutN